MGRERDKGHARVSARILKMRIYEVVEAAGIGDRVSAAYDWIMLIAIFVSIIPLVYKEAPSFFKYTDILTTILFIADYLLRWWTADFKLRRGMASYVIYPFTGWAIVDLLSILPTLTLLNEGFKLFRLFRIFRTLRVFKAMRYSNSFRIIAQVIRQSREALGAVVMLAVGYILVSAMVIFSVEPDSFDNFFEAVYWATVSLTTVGYGDIYPVTAAGRIITMVSSVFGVAVVALPAGIITAGYMTTMQEVREKRQVEKAEEREIRRRRMERKKRADNEP